MKFMNAKYNRLRVYKVTIIPIRKLIQKQLAEINEQRLKAFDRTNPLTTNQSKSILLQLLDIGIDRYLKYGIGGSKDNKQTQLIIQQTSSFLDHV